MQITTRKFLVLNYMKKRNCKVCNTSLFRGVVYSNKENQYCMYCAVIKNFLDVKEMNSFGYFPNQKAFSKALEKKRKKIIHLNEDILIRQRDSKINASRKKRQRLHIE